MVAASGEMRTDSKTQSVLCSEAGKAAVKQPIALLRGIRRYLTQLRCLLNDFPAFTTRRLSEIVSYKFRRRINPGLVDSKC